MTPPYRPTLRPGPLALLLLGLAGACAAQNGETPPSEPAQAPRATHRESGALCETPRTRIGKLTAFCLDRSGNILACDGRARAVKVITPDDSLLAVWKIGFSPEAIAVGPDGSVYVGGAKALARLDRRGGVLRKVSTIPPSPLVTSITVGGGEVFVAAESNRGYAVYRVNPGLTACQKIIDGLSGCCGQMDIAWRDGVLRVAENGRKQIVSYDRTGKRLAAFVRDGETDDIENFSGCCNPKNLCYGPRGILLTSESEVGCVKAFTSTGGLIGVLGTVTTPPGCVRVTVQSNADGSRIYVLDGDKNVVRVLSGSPIDLKAVGGRRNGTVSAPRVE